MNQREIDKHMNEFARELRRRNTNPFTFRCLMRSEMQRLARLSGDVHDRSIHPRNWPENRPGVKLNTCAPRRAAS